MEKTGEMLRLNEISYLAILYIDINHDKAKVMNSEEEVLTKNKIIEIRKENKFVLGQTPSGGFQF